MCASLCFRIRGHTPAEQLSVDKYHSPVMLIIVIMSCDVLVVATRGPNQLVLTRLVSGD